MTASDPFIAIRLFFKVLLQLLIQSTVTELYVFEKAVWTVVIRDN